MFTTTRTVVFRLAPTVIALTLIGMGVMIGRYTVVRRFKKRIRRYNKAETLGRMLDRKEKQDFSHAYTDAEEARRDIDGYSWAVPNVPTPFVGNAPKPGVHDNARINSMQFRMDGELAMPKPTNVCRIFLVGGSTALGSGAPSQDRTVAAYLEKFLNSRLSGPANTRYEVVTAANQAWASTHERITIENRLVELAPDMVIALSGNNDVHWALMGRNILHFRTYADKFYWDLINTAYSVAGYPEAPEVAREDAEPIPPPLVGRRLAGNARLSSFALSLDDTPYLFVLQPTLAVTKKALTQRERATLNVDKDYFIDCYEHMRDRLENVNVRNFHYVDLSGMFDNLDDGKNIFIDSYHFGDRGNEMVADAMFEHVKRIIESQPGEAGTREHCQ